MAQLGSELSVYHVNYPESGILKLPRRLLPEEIWLPPALATCRRVIARHRPQALVTSGPPHCVHLAGLCLRRWYKLPWIADFRDPWVTPLGERKTLTARQRVDLLFERRVMDRADAIVANAPRHQELLQRAFPETQEKFCTITNGYDPADFHIPAESAPTNGHVRVVHTGELYAGRDPRSFLDALGELAAGGNPSRRFEVEFIGQTHGLDREIERRGVSHLVRLAGQVSHAQAVREMVAADILLLLDKPGRRIGVPAKLYEYLGAGRPVLALAESDGDTARILEQSGLPYRIAPPRDPQRIKRAMIELAAQAAAGCRPRPESLANFTREHMAARMADLIRHCVRRRNHLKKEDSVTLGTDR
jgi:glycosyltransferase involved in cell wall biosynthesis